MNKTIFLRLFVEVNMKSEAENAANKLLELINEFVEVENQTIQKYWKIPEYYELFFKLNALRDLETDYRNILDKLGTGWKPTNEYENIWNFGDNNNFALETVKWAHLECEIE